MVKDKVMKALDEIQDGRDAGHYHDELETIIGVMTNLPESTIASAWAEVCQE